MRSAKACRAGQVGAGRKKGFGARLILQFKRHQKPRPRHLLAGQSVRRITGQPRIAQPLHPPLPRQPFRNDLSRGAHPLQPHLQRLQPAMHEPSLKPARNRPGNPPPIPHAAHQPGIAPRDMAKQHIRMPGRRLGIGGHNQIRPQIEGPLQQRRHRRVVDNDPRPHRPRPRRNRSNIAQVQPRVRRRFQMNHRHPGQVHRRHRQSRHFLNQHPHRNQKIPREHPCHIIAIRWDDHPIARLDRRHQGRRDRRHARRERNTRRVLQNGQLLLDLLPDRRRHPRVSERRPLNLGQMIGRRCHNRRHNRIALGQPMRPVMQHPCEPALGHRVDHSSRPGKPSARRSVPNTSSSSFTICVDCAAPP